MIPKRDFYVVAYPDISKDDRDWIEGIRRDHDPNAARIAAHLTLAFAISGCSAERIHEHLSGFAQSECAIRLICRHVMVGHDHVNPIYHVFLVPDEGLSAINLLRTRLHTGPLEDQLDPKIPFIPHITLASGNDADAIQNQCQMLNAQQPLVRGTLNALTLVEVETNALSEKATFPLQPSVS